MKKMFRKAITVMLCVALFMSAVPMAFAADKDFTKPVHGEAKTASKAEKTLLDGVDVILNALINGINALTHTPRSWETEKDYSSDGFTAGQTDFLDAPADNAVWSMGYARASITEGQDITDGKHYVAGSLSVTDKVVSKVYDEQFVRTIAMNDGSGRGTVVFCVIDGYGMSSTDVRAIRQELADFCAQNDVAAVNITVLHQHSAVDTFGMNGPLFSELLNPWRDLFGKKMVNGQNETYMRNLFDKTEQSVKEAVAAMKTGKLYFSTVDASAYVRDKRPAFVMDTDLNLFRFIPEDGSRQIWFSTYTAHCVGNGAGGTEVTADYPLYMEQTVNEEANADFMLFLGAEQGTSQVKDSIEGIEEAEKEELGGVKLYGKTLANLLIEKGEENAVEVAPLLNVAYKEVLFSISNPILTFAGKMGLVTNKVVRAGLCKYKVVSEIGYMELGNDLALAFVPGELAAELAYGGTLPASQSWSGEDWTYPTMQSQVGERQLLILGIMNDQVGYIIPGNDYMALLYGQNKSLELVALGKNTAAELSDAFGALVKECKAK